MNARTLAMIAGIGLIAAGAAILWPPSRSAVGQSGHMTPIIDAPTVPEAPKDRVERVEIPPKATFGVLMESSGVGTADANAIYEAAKGAYDLASIRAGRAIDLIYALDGGALKELVYPINDTEELHVRRQAGTWNAAREAIDYEVRRRTVEGTVESSLYAAALGQGIDERAVVAMADVFEWTIDFAQDVRVGDAFKFIYEERWRNGTYVMPGNVLAAEYVNAGKAYRGYRFVDAEGDEGYYDEEGGSLRRMFLKAPVAFRYISSGFTTGMRYVSAFNTSTGHRAIDYAAQAGTPIRSTAEGVVSFAGWDGPYGNKVSIRHNGTYSTNYAHQSKIAVRRGQKVAQGEIIGYVGSTGFSTGPHLHYEMVKNGVKINPMNEDFPGTDPVKPDEMAAFQEAIKAWEGEF